MATPAIRRQRASHRRSAPVIFLFSILASFAVSRPVLAQGGQLRVQINGRDVNTAESTKWSLEAPNDQDALSWLKRAREAADREDWKLAADTLERVVDQHGDRTVSVDGSHFYSARRLVQEQIASWPESGLVAYRLLYDADAKRLLDQAKATYDLDALRTIARRLPLTIHGPEALDLLASWLIDRRQAREALHVLAQLETLPHSHVAKWRLLERRAVAYIIAGQRERAGESIEAMRSLTIDVPADWPTQIESIQRFFESVKNSPSSVDEWSSSAWPGRLGPQGHNGRTGPIEPTMSQFDGWTVDLPGADRVDDVAVAGVMSSQYRPPVWQVASDGARLFVTSPSGLMARDLATFELLWQAFPRTRWRDPRVEQHRTLVNFGGGQQLFVDNEQPTVRLDPLTTTALYYDYRGELSVIDGLVLVLEQDAPMDEQLPTKTGVLPPNAHLGDEILTEPNALRAYEAETGRALWSHGRGGPASDELRNAHFCATPVACSAGMAVPYRIGGDLWLGILDREGALLRSVVLGTGRASLYSIYSTLPPLVYDGTIYVQSGAGLVFAVDEHDLSLRWLTRYDSINRQLDGGRHGGQWWIDASLGVPQPDQWLVSPPVISRGVVVMAPLDSDQLLAFDIESGEERWHAPRRDYRYIVGADEEKVVVAGENLAAISLDNGEPLWSTKPIKAVGRPQICGEEILVPTIDGLGRISLATGRKVGKVQEFPGRLGNLFSIDGAMYSVSARELSKFPDPDQTRNLAEDRLAKNPADLDALLRLAWLDSLAGKWNDALSYLDRAEGELTRAARVDQFANAPDSADEYRNRISHQRVGILLKMSDQLDDAERESTLKRAFTESRRNDDRLESGLARCDFLDELGRAGDGFDLAFELLTESERQPLRLERDLRVRADVLLSERLAGFWRDMPDSEREACSIKVDAAIDAARSAGRRSLLTTLADALAFGRWGCELDLRLGLDALGGSQPETGIFFLNRAARRACDATHRLEALIRLAIAYRFPGDDLPADYSSTLEVLDQLSRDYADAMMPAGIELRRGVSATTRVADFVTQLRGTLPAELASGKPVVPEILRTAHLLDVDMEALTPGGNRGVAQGGLFWDASRRTDVFAEVQPVQLDRGIHGLDLRDASSNPSWWTTRSRETDDEFPATESPARSPIYDASICGRVAILHGPGAVTAIGLTTGKMLWPPLDVDGSAGALPEPAVVSIGDVVIIAVDSQTLVAAHARNDASPIWRRRWSRVLLGKMRVVEDSLVVVDQAKTRAYVVDPSTGRSKAEYTLVPDLPGDSDEQVDSTNPDAFVAIERGVIVRSEGTRLVARDARNGAPLWPPFVCDDIINGIFELGSGCIGVSHGSRAFTILKAISGDVVRELPVAGLSMPPIDVVIDAPDGVEPPDGGRVVMFTRQDATPFEFLLDSYSFSSSELHWKRELGTNAWVSRQMMRASTEFVAALRYESAPEQERSARRLRPGELDFTMPPKLEVINKRTSERFSPRPYQFDEQSLGDDNTQVSPLSRAARQIREVVVFNHRIIAVANEGFFILGDKAQLTASGGDEP